jgi:hypothetical protein
LSSPKIFGVYALKLTPKKLEKNPVKNETIKIIMGVGEKINVMIDTARKRSLMIIIDFRLYLSANTPATRLDKNPPSTLIPRFAESHSGLLVIVKITAFITIISIIVPKSENALI